eukprot:scaffold297_cov171-Amphora_coffeaeformis.AAC.16
MIGDSSRRLSSQLSTSNEACLGGKPLDQMCSIINCRLPTNKISPFLSMVALVRCLARGVFRLPPMVYGTS